MRPLHERRAEQLVEKGFRCLDESAYDEALSVASELEALRHTASFEIGALARCGKGDIEGAVAVLERGVELAPTVWVNWQLLGNCRSDLERYDDAWAAYLRALDCPDVWRDSVFLNQATLRAREGRADDALGILGGIRDAELQRPATSLRLRTLLDLARHDEAVALSRNFLAELEGDAPDSERGARRGLLARALFRAGSTSDAHSAAVASLAEDRGNQDALWTLRELGAERSPQGKYFRILLHANAAEERFYSTFDVVADDLDDALRLVRATEPDIVLLQVDDVAVLEDRSNELKGVYALQPREFYAPER